MERNSEEHQLSVTKSRIYNHDFNIEVAGSRQVIILIGIPGSGKTTFARTIGGATIVSADDYHINETGQYVFEYDNLDPAHMQCYSRFCEALQRRDDIVIVDNTNLSLDEISPYRMEAKRCGYTVSLVRFEVDPEVCIERQTHDVPVREVWRMWFKKKQLRISYRWGRVVDPWIAQGEALLEHAFSCFDALDDDFMTLRVMDCIRSILIHAHEVHETTFDTDIKCAMAKLSGDGLTVFESERYLFVEGAFASQEPWKNVGLLYDKETRYLGVEEFDTRTETITDDEEE